MSNPIQPAHVIRDVAILVVVGILLWAINQIGIIDAGYKKLINVLAIACAVLWVLYDLFGRYMP